MLQVIGHGKEQTRYNQDGDGSCDTAARGIFRVGTRLNVAQHVEGAEDGNLRPLMGQEADLCKDQTLLNAETRPALSTKASS